MERRCARAFMVLLGMTLVILGEVTMVHGDGGQLSPSQCHTERQLLTNACRSVVFGQLATPACCQRVKISHFECICPMFTPKLASILGVQRVIKLLQGCGRRVPRHFKCGSLNFP